MKTFINPDRPPVYCPGCTHEKITTGLDRALVQLGFSADKIAIVTDIGCSGLFDTRFNVHALHGIHGRALTYAAGLKLADPSLNVIVTMGDGGLGIGGAHLLAACRRNLDLTLIILNNFNFGMTGGQYSVTTPHTAMVGSGFLNQAEIPLDICAIAQSAGATYVDKCSGYDPALPDKLAGAIRHHGFSIIETLGLCTGRYTKNNKLTPTVLDQMVNTPDTRTHPSGLVKQNLRPEYGDLYRKLAKTQAPLPELVTYEQKIEIKDYTARQVVILGSAGMRIVTAGELLCIAGLFAGMNVSMKNDYNITVLRGQSVCEVIISPEKIGYTGVESPTIVLALSEEGVQRRKTVFSNLSAQTLVIKEKSISLPSLPSSFNAKILEVDFKSLKIQKQDWALAAIGILANQEKVLNHSILNHALNHRFAQAMIPGVMKTLEKVIDIT
ncbi:MAG: thiamine pyrophosphate-dependent enzyme [Pseudomonadota bacterium]